MIRADTPLLSIIVLAYNGMAYLPECLESVCRQIDKRMEVIVVDNGSRDESADYIRSKHPKCFLISLRKNRGFCAGMNLGVKKARGEYVLLLNQDVALQENCLESIIKALIASSEEVIGVFPKVKFYDYPVFINAYGVDWHETCHWRDTRVGLPDLGLFSYQEKVFGSIFPAVAFKKKLFLKIGGFDEMFWSYCEDFDVCYRANIAGYTFMTVPDAVILHKYRASSRDDTDPLWSRYWFIRNYLLVFLKNYRWKYLLKYRYIIFMRYFGHAFRFAWQGHRWKEVMMMIKILLSLLLWLPFILHRRLIMRSIRKKDDPDVWSRGLVEEFNLYHVDGKIVLSLNALRAATKGEKFSYTVQDRTYVTK